MPDVQWQGWSLLAVSRDFLRHEAWPEASFLWPMIMLDPDDLWQIHSGTPFQVQRQMSRGRFLEIMRGILHEVGVPRAEAVAAGYNRLRRFLPTLANCLQFEPVAMQAIGSWFEIPDAGGPTPTSRPVRASMPMGLHYSGEKASRSAHVKNAAFEMFFKLWRRKQPEVAWNAEGLLSPGAWTWPELAATAATLEAPKLLQEDFPPLLNLPLAASRLQKGRWRVWNLPNPLHLQMTWLPSKKMTRRLAKQDQLAPQLLTFPQWARTWWA